MDEKKKQLVLMEALKEIKNLAKSQGNMIGKEQLDELLEELALEKEQMNLVVEYLLQNKIGIDETLNPEDFMSNEDKNYLEIYLEELKSLPERNDGEKKAITIAAMAGEKDAQASLIEIFLPEVIEIAKLYAGQGAMLEELIGEGNVALTMGVGMLNCLETPEEVDGMLGKMIMDAMEDYINIEADEANAEETLVEKVNTVAEKIKELYETLGRKITVWEVANETQFSIEEIEEVLLLSEDLVDYIEGGKDENGK